MDIAFSGGSHKVIGPQMASESEEGKMRVFLFKITRTH